jgi:hypothetical protein
MSTERQEPADVPRVGALDLPEGASPRLATLLRAAAGPAEEAELLGESAAVATFMRETSAPASGGATDKPAIRGQLPGIPGTRRPRMSVRSVRTLAAAAVISVVFGGGLAAADVLPAPAQRWVSRALGAVGIDVPSPDHPRSTAAAVRLSPADVEAVPARTSTRGAAGPDHLAAPGPNDTPARSPAPAESTRAAASAGPGGDSSPSGTGPTTTSASRGPQPGTGNAGSKAGSSNSGAGKAGSSAKAGGSGKGASGQTKPGNGRKNGATKQDSGSPAASRPGSPSRPAPAAAHRPPQSAGHSSRSGKSTK